MKGTFTWGIFRSMVIIFLGVASAGVARESDMTILEEYQLRLANLDTDDHFDQYDLGLWCINNDLLDEAIEVLEDARASKVSDAYTHYQLGRAYAAVGNYRQAKEKLKGAIWRIIKPVEKTPELRVLLDNWDELLKVGIKKWDPDYASLMVDSARQIIKVSKPVVLMMERSKWQERVDEVKGGSERKTFTNYDILDHRSLRHCDVVVKVTMGKPFISEYGDVINLTYDDYEVEEILHFVSQGGGFFISGNGAEWNRVNKKKARDTGREPLSHHEMPQNRIAEAFGLHYTKQSLTGEIVKQGFVSEHECFGDFNVDDRNMLLNAWYCRMESVNPDARVLMRDGERNPIGYALQYGLGRVIALGAMELPRDETSKNVVARMLQWLGEKETSLEAGHYYDQLFINESRFFEQLGKFKVLYPPGLAYRLPALLDMTASAANTVEDYFGLPLPEMKIRMIPRFQGGAAATHLSVPAAAPSHMFVAITSHEMSHKLYTGILGEAIAAWGGFKGMIGYGFGSQAESKFNERLDTFWENDPHATDIDISSKEEIKGALGKRLWVFQNLEERYGGDIFRRFNEERRKDDRLKGMMSMDDFVYYMSLAAGEDLYLWFRQIGTTVNPKHTGLPTATGLPRVG
jgi:hypothetical protein